MGIAAASKAQYENAIKKLFPKGDYWDEQFSDPESDVAFFVKAKADELICFRERMSNLYNESQIETAGELIEDWERVLLAGSNIKKTLVERKQFLKTQDDDFLNYTKIRKIAQIFGFCIFDIYFPYRSAFFGFSRFGLDRFTSPVSWQVINILIDTQGNGDKFALFEAFIRQKMLVNYIPQFLFYGGT